MFPYIHKHYINNLFRFLFYAKPTFSPARLKYCKGYYLKYYSVFYTTDYSRCYFYSGLVINFR